MLRKTVLFSAILFISVSCSNSSNKSEANVESGTNSNQANRIPLTEVTIEQINSQVLEGAKDDAINLISRGIPTEKLNELTSKIGPITSDKIMIGNTIRVKSSMRNTVENYISIREDLKNSAKLLAATVSESHLSRLAAQAMIEAGDYYRVPILIKNGGYIGSVLVSAYDTSPAGGARAYLIDFDQIQSQDPLSKITALNETADVEAYTLRGFCFEGVDGPIIKSGKNYMGLYTKKIYSIDVKKSIQSQSLDSLGFKLLSIEGNLVPVLKNNL